MLRPGPASSCLLARIITLEVSDQVTPSVNSECLGMFVRPRPGDTHDQGSVDDRKLSFTNQRHYNEICIQKADRRQTRFFDKETDGRQAVMI